MNLARGLERRLEGLVEGLAAKLFRGRIEPTELATRLVREADLALVEGPAGPTVPNVFGVLMNPSDLGGETAPQEVLDELATVVHLSAVERGWRMEGMVMVEILTDPTLTRGSLEIASSFVPSSQPAWAHLRPRAGGVDLGVAPNRAVVGRGEEADVRVHDDATSRRHSLLWREGGVVWLADLGSANGTRHNGLYIEEPTRVTPGDALTFGTAQFVFRPA